MGFSKVDWFASIGAMLLAIVLAVSVSSGWIQTTDVSGAIAYALVAGIVACLTALVIPRLTGDKSEEHLARKFAEEKQKLEQVDLKRGRIWQAIKEWIDLPITRFRDQKDTLPLGEKPPESAVEIEDCLRQNYPSLWADLQKFRQEYYAWKNEDVSKRFTTYENGHPVVYVDPKRDYNESMCRKLTSLHSQLVEQIRSDILDRDQTRLKCGVGT